MEAERDNRTLEQIAGVLLLVIAGVMFAAGGFLVKQLATGES